MKRDHRSLSVGYAVEKFHEEMHDGQKVKVVTKMRLVEENPFEYQSPFNKAMTDLRVAFRELFEAICEALHIDKVLNYFSTQEKTEVQIPTDPKYAIGKVLSEKDGVITVGLFHKDIQKNRKSN